jgi:hypothetical protein
MLLAAAITIVFRKWVLAILIVLAIITAAKGIAAVTC